MIGHRAVFMLFISFVALAVPAAGASDATDWSAKPGELAMKLTVIGVQEITAYEPVVVRQELTNTTNHEVRQSVQPEWTNRVEIMDEKGRVVFQTALKPVPVHFFVATPVYAPKQSRSYWLIISALYTFKDPGTYTIKVSEGMTRRDGSAFDAVSTGSATIKVLPFDEARLNARCREGYDMLTGKATPADDVIPHASRTRVLYSLRHDVALPYLARYCDSYAIRAMRRMGTEKAKEMIDRLTDPSSEEFEGARKALELPLEVSSWDWHT